MTTAAPPVEPSPLPPGSATRTPVRSPDLFAILRDQRFLRAVGQLIFVAIAVYLLVGLWNNITSELTRSGLAPTFDFLDNPAGFEIGGAVGYTPDQSFWQAFLVGLRNTLMSVVVGLIGATVLGILGGIFLLSTNWLIRNITRAIVEVLRNIPLLIVIFVMFFVVVLALPPLRDSLTFPGDGLLAVPYRLIAYVAIYLLASASLSRSQPGRRAFWLSLIISVAAAAEFLFWMGARDARFAAIYSAGIGGTAGLPALVHLIVTLIGFTIVGRTPIPNKAVWSGILVGQWIGFDLYLFGVLPTSAYILQTTPAFFLNNRGFVFPTLQPTARFAEWMAFVGLGIGLGVFAFLFTRRLTETTGKPYPHFAIAALVLGVFTLAGWIIVSGQPLPSQITVNRDGAPALVTLEEARTAELLSPADELLYAQNPIQVTLPRRQGLRFATGETLSPEYIALTGALIIYTAAFIAEIVRAGILAVPRGQLEASRALGLTGGQMLRMVILPQALRVIIPPLTNQYLNLAKNSSLAVAISFADVYQVMNTVINTSGQSVTGVMIIMATYLIMSLIIAAVMNVINSRFQLVTR